MSFLLHCRWAAAPTAWHVKCLLRGVSAAPCGTKPSKRHDEAGDRRWIYSGAPHPACRDIEGSVNAILHAFDVEDLTVTFGKVDVLRGPAFSVERGTSLATIGRMGRERRSYSRRWSEPWRTEGGSVGRRAHALATRRRSWISSTIPANAYRPRSQVTTTPRGPRAPKRCLSRRSLLSGFRCTSREHWHRGQPHHLLGHTAE